MEVNLAAARGHGGLVVAKPSQIFRGFVIELLSGETLMLEVFSRHTFGERYLTSVRLAEGNLFFFAYVLIFGGVGVDVLRLASSRSAEDWPSIPPALVLYYLAFLALGAFHRFEIFYRNLTSDRVVHSHSYGVSWPFQWLARQRAGLPVVSEWTIYRYIEPWGWFLMGGLLVLAAGLWEMWRGILGLPSGEGGVRLLGVWIALLSVVLWLKNGTVYMQQREQELDVSDARIVAAAQAVAGKDLPMEATGGYKVTPVPRALDVNRDGAPDDDDAILRRFLRGYGEAREEAGDG